MQETIVNRQIKVIFELITSPYLWEQSPFNGEDFVCLFVVNDKDISINTQSYLSDKLIEYGCRHACCIGDNCASWDNSIDFSYLEKNEYKVRDDNFVMTSWFEDDSIEDIVFFFINNTNFDDYTFKNYLVLFLGKDEDKKASINSEIVKDIL